MVRCFTSLRLINKILLSWSPSFVDTKDGVFMLMSVVRNQKNSDLC